jgi:AraC family transcriptional activator of pobA
MIPVHTFDILEKVSIENIEIKDVDVYINEPHSHNFYEIGYFENTEGEHTIDFTKYPIKKCTIYFLKKGIVHTLLRKKGSSGKVISFHDDLFTDQVLKQKLLFVEPHLYLSDYQFNLFLQLFSQIENYLLYEHCKKELIANYLQLILSFFENYAITQITKHERIHDFLLYVDQNFSAKLTVDECVTKLNTTYQTLYNEVHKKLNKTPIELIKERLILQAKRLLFNTNQTIKEIAYELDFEDASYFSKYFKTYTGETPLIFREQSRI